MVSRSLLSSGRRAPCREPLGKRIVFFLPVIVMTPEITLEIGFGHDNPGRAAGKVPHLRGARNSLVDMRGVPTGCDVINIK